MAEPQDQPTTMMPQQQQQQQQSQPQPHLQGPALPRSVRWRMQMGLLKYPESDIGWTIADLHAYNEQVLNQQRAAYKSLCDQYIQQQDSVPMNEMVVEEDEDGFLVDRQQPEMEEEISESEQQEEKLRLDDMDPLTMIVMDMEKKEKRRQELELKYRKEKALRKRGVAVTVTVAVEKVMYHDDTSGGDRFDTYSVSRHFKCDNIFLICCKNIHPSCSFLVSFCQKKHTRPQTWIWTRNQQHDLYPLCLQLNSHAPHLLAHHHQLTNN
jgi:hypothetical protein